MRPAEHYAGCVIQRSRFRMVPYVGEWWPFSRTAATSPALTISCAEQRSRTSRTRAPVALTDPSEPWWTKPVHALQLQGLSSACDHRPWSCERVLYSLHRRVLAVLHLDPIGASPAAIGAIDATSLEVMQAIYRNPAQPISRGMRAAQAALAFEHPKLATSRDFARHMNELARARGKSNAIDAPKPALSADGRVASPEGDIG